MSCIIERSPKHSAAHFLNIVVKLIYQAFLAVFLQRRPEVKDGKLILVGSGFAVPLSVPQMQDMKVEEFKQKQVLTEVRAAV